MGDGTSLINLGEIAEPVKVLIEKISEGIGGLARPYQIKRVAKAEADAEKIHALAEIEINELQRRALTRFIAEETKKQSNIEDITNKAIPGLSENTRPQDIDNDWIANFIDKCKLISDEEMQILWGKVLAGEANSPGKYSKRTINFLSNMDKSDAEMFSMFCRYVCDLGGDPTPIIINLVDKIYDANGMNYDVIKHLQDIGLIIFDPHGSFNIQHIPQTIFMNYQGNRYKLELSFPKDNILEIGKVLLSKVGRELVQLVGSNSLEYFVEYVIEHIKTEGCKVYTEDGKQL